MHPFDGMILCGFRKYVFRKTTVPLESLLSDGKTFVDHDPKEGERDIIIRRRPRTVYPIYTLFDKANSEGAELS